MHATDVRNLCTSLVLLVMHEVDARSPEEEKNPTHKRQHWKHLSHILSFPSPSLFTHPPLKPFSPCPQWNSSTSESTNSAENNHLPIHLPTRHQCSRTSRRLPAAKGCGAPTPDGSTSSKLTVLKALFNLPLSASEAVIVIHSDGRCWWSIKHHRTSNWKYWGRLAIFSLPVFMKMKCQTATFLFQRHACAGCVQNYKGHERLSFQPLLLQKEKKELQQTKETGGEGNTIPILIAIWR